MPHVGLATVVVILARKTVKAAIKTEPWILQVFDSFDTCDVLTLTNDFYA